MSQQDIGRKAKEPSLGQKVRWPLIVVALLGTHASLMMLGVSWALANASSFATPAIYKNSMSWDEQQQAIAESKKLGWELRITASVLPELNGDRKVVFELVDKESQLVESGDLSITLYHIAEANITITRKLLPQKDHRYVATLPMRRSGSWHLQATASQAGENLNKDFFYQQEFWIAPLSSAPKSDPNSEQTNALQGSQL